MELTSKQIERLAILNKAVKEFSRIERRLRVGKPNRFDLFYGAEFNIGSRGEYETAVIDSVLLVDVETARLIWPHIKRVIEAEYKKLGGKKR